ncbi:MAG: aminoacetone oxidase family FAD-binding enzyme [Eubacteriales bacterium]|nr:aminoacetone oxidase family FAD-binding enzyme [Eubacteriales bacterium]MDD4327535.1 aminoacetone oxidase family FAD-binding enzyme [Eubacteriales bacterium]MDD4718027.1 aminoacetone oxidase family FAD-binding enzyme [Eubacteriales bacterium]
MSVLRIPYADIVIVGGGAAGMIAAITAAQYSSVPGNTSERKKIVIIERHSIVGRKILATGNGTCNLSNAKAVSQYSSRHYYGTSLFGVEEILNEFSPADTMNFFNRIGIECETEENGKIYPFCRQASAVRNALEQKAAELGVIICRKTEVKTIKCDEDIFSVEVSSSNVKDFKDRSGSLREQSSAVIRKFCEDVTSTGRINAGKVIITTGGKASPSLSSDGLGYDLSVSLGHSVESLYPAVVKIIAKPLFRSDVSGIRINTRLKLCYSGADISDPVSEEAGELLFTDNGISGPAAMQISGRMKPGHKYDMVIDMLPDISEQDLKELLIRRMTDIPYRRVTDFLEGLLPDRLGRALCELCSQELSDKRADSLSPEVIGRMTESIKRSTINIEGTEGWKDAQVTAGGIPLSEIKVPSMESALKSGLFLAGEILDVTGDCGGFNLQFAWSSGYLAGKSASADK